MRKFLQIPQILLFTVLVVYSTRTWARMYDRVIAKLNGELILLSELSDTLRERKGLINISDPIEKADKECVKALLDRTLLLELAKRSGAPVPEDEIQSQVEMMVADVQVRYSSKAEFLRDVEEQYGSLEKFKQDLAHRTTIDYRISQLIGSRFTITDADVARYIEECRREGHQPESYHLRRLAVRISEETTAGQARALARVARLMRRATEERLQFSEAAKRYSEIPGERELGGDLGYISASKLAPQVRAAVDKLSPGEVTPPMVTGQFACIFYLEAKRGAKSALFEKRFMQSREALLREHRRKAYLVVYDQRLATKIPDEYRACLQSPVAAKVSATVAGNSSGENTTSAEPAGQKRKARLSRLLNPFRR